MQSWKIQENLNENDKRINPSQSELISAINSTSPRVIYILQTRLVDLVVPSFAFLIIIRRDLDKQPKLGSNAVVLSDNVDRTLTIFRFLDRTLPMTTAIRYNMDIPLQFARDVKYVDISSMSSAPFYNDLVNFGLSAKLYDQSNIAMFCRRVCEILLFEDELQKWTFDKLVGKLGCLNVSLGWAVLLILTINEAVQYLGLDDNLEREFLVLKDRLKVMAKHYKINPDILQNNALPSKSTEKPKKSKSTASSPVDELEQFLSDIYPTLSPPKYDHIILQHFLSLSPLYRARITVDKMMFESSEVASSSEDAMEKTARVVLEYYQTMYDTTAQ